MAATIVVAVLLVMLAVGILSLSTITTRSTRGDNADAVAKANARLALQLAIGQLQMTAGPDQRVTATATIMPDVAAGKRHWTGVWDTKDWKVTEPEKRPSFPGW